jgi:organic radical activating enzyme
MCPDEILGVLRNFPCRFVVITGGEPFRQNISVLVARLLLANYRVQIETNGMLYRELSWGNPDLHVVCCPKAASVSEQLLPNIMAWKYVIREGEIDPQDGLPLSHLGRKSSPARFPDGFPLEQVFVNPMDEGDAAANQRNLEAAADVCLQYGYRLGVQMHKLANLP